MNTIALPLRRFKAGIWFLFLGSIASFLALILRPDRAYEGYTLLAIAMCLWSMGLLMITAFFPAEVPEIGSDDRFFTRLLKRLRHGFIWLVALITALTGIAIVISCIQLLLFAWGEFKSVP